MKERGPSFFVNIVRGPITQLTSVTSCIDIPTQATDREQETKCSRRLIVLGESSLMEVTKMRLLSHCQDLVKNSPSN